MELIRGLSNLRERHLGAVVAIGAFDGIHLGHQALLQRLCDHAARRSRPAMALTFEPLPREYLFPECPPARLTSWRERWHILGRCCLDSMCVLRFGEGLRNLSGTGFANLLAHELRSECIVVGHDFRFGRNGEATASMLEGAGAALGFQVDVVPPVLLEGVRVSSSGVREALAAGQFDLARRWLGRPYSMMGRVVHGKQLGRELGFPTANLLAGRRRVALSGIFAVRVHGVASEPLPGVANMGTRPTVAGKEVLLEAHIFDFSGDLYDREIEVEFVAKLREEVRFANLDELVKQMHRDAGVARQILAP
jgi:riboflavin kinase/FMN adenylyltransferase